MFWRAAYRDTCSSALELFRSYPNRGSLKPTVVPPESRKRNSIPCVGGSLGATARLAAITGPLLGGLAAQRLGARRAIALAPGFALLALLAMAIGLPSSPSAKADSDDSSLAAAYCEIVRAHWRVLFTTAFFGLLIFVLRTSRDLHALSACLARQILRREFYYFGCFESSGGDYGVWAERYDRTCSGKPRDT